MNTLTRVDTFDELVMHERAKWTHKGTLGHVFIIGASQNMPGAGIMTAYSALKSGAGLSTLILPAQAFGHVDPKSLEIMYAPVKDQGKGYFLDKNCNEVLKLTQKARMVALGPGLGTKSETTKFIQNFIIRYKGPLLIDADGLNAIAKNPKLLLKREGVTVLTPHFGEMSRLCHKSIESVLKNPLKIAQAFAYKYKVFLILKGYHSIIVNSDQNYSINPTGGPSMANAGQGDALSGILTGLIAEHGFCMKVLQFGVFLHGLVGDLLTQKGFKVVMARDIIENLNLGYTALRQHN